MDTDPSDSSQHPDSAPLTPRKSPSKKTKAAKRRTASQRPPRTRSQSQQRRSVENRSSAPISLRVASSAAAADEDNTLVTIGERRAKLLGRKHDRAMDYESVVPPTYTIDLSLPPAERYVEVAIDFLPVARELPLLFDEVIGGLPNKQVHLFSRLLLRRLYSSEQTEELRGISNVTGIPMYLLIAFNALLDLFMGCTSGGVVTKWSKTREPKMVHFRTLDWGMDPLRKALAQFEFRETEDGPVIATTISYVGYVGMLTAVRPGLSLSLNFRPYHNDDTSHLSNFKYRSHQLLVLLGLRPSISSLLREFILPSTVHRGYMSRLADSGHPNLAHIAEHFASVPTTAAYLTFCDGSRTLILEKDRVTAKVLSSTHFIATTNHDVSYEASDDPEAKHIAHAKIEKFDLIVEDVVKESIERKGCLTEKWGRLCYWWEKDQTKKVPPYATLGRLKKWMGAYPVTNEQTHFVTIMDPVKGEIAWVQAFGADGNEDV